jgi:carboxyl-terminal processing protease
MMALSAVMIVLSLFLLGQISGRFVGGLFAKELTTEQEPSFGEFSDLFAEVYQEIADKYVDELEPEDVKEVFEGAIQGMFLALGDPHSQFLTPDTYSQLEKDTEGEFSGIGIHIALFRVNEDDPDDDTRVLTVVSPMPGSPAAKVGVQAWDRIVEIEGESTEGIDIFEAVRKLTGPEGTKVAITVERDKEPEPLHFTITRKQIKIESVYSRLLEGGILMARIVRFSDNTTDDLRKVIEEAREKEARGLIIDLRWNTGGLLKESISVSDLFLDEGLTIVSTGGRLENQNQEYTAKDDTIVDWPMLILVNRSSASASEIFAGAMRDNQRGLLVGPKGERTFGKGSVQTINPLEFSLERDENGNPRSNAIRITTARYLTPSGAQISNKDRKKAGLASDIEVDVTFEHEIEVSRHGLLLGDPNMVEPGKEEQQEDAKEDGVKEDGVKDGELEEPLRDVLLEVAVKEMKRILASKPTETPVLLSANAEVIEVADGTENVE